MSVSLDRSLPANSDLTNSPSSAMARDNSFDTLRMIAAMSVLIAHQLSLAGVYFPNYYPPNLSPWGPKLADAGLYVFFALSGYLMFRSLSSDRRIIRFAMARILRIYPGAIVNTIFCILFGALLTSASQSMFWTSDLIQNYFLHNTLIIYPPTQFQLTGFLAHAPFPAVNTPIWTLKYELLAYVILFFIFRFAYALRLWLGLIIATMTIVMVVGFYYTRAYPRQDGVGLDSLGSFYFVHVVRFFSVFFFGALYAATEITHRKPQLFLVLTGVALISFFSSDHMTRIAFILIMAAAAIELGKSSLLHFKFYQQVGDLSYGTYLYAFPIQIVTVTYFLTSSNFWWLTAIDVLIIVVLAKISWTQIEKPALLLKRRF